MASDKGQVSMDNTKENQPRRQQDASRTGAATRHAKRPMSAIIPSIMGDHQQGLLGQPRSGSATSGNPGGQQASRQHKLKQRFTVIRKLGKGTYGKVQLAINKETGQEVAIKTIKKTKIENEQDLERVRREIQIMSSIEHPHIIHIYEVFENKDKIVLIMQYAPGGELYEYVSQSKVLDEHEARRLFRQIATAIYYCHQNKICHRDLKLENILLDEKNNAKLADFGLSNVFDKSRQLKTFCGSPLYASPEIVQGSPYEGPEVDCWSLGVLLYTLVYGAMPFDGSNFKRLVKQISDASYYEPKQRSHASPLISRLLCADPLKRASIKDICLDPWVNGHQLSLSSPLASPAAVAQQRLSPTNNGQPAQQHPLLLKVAQDMANLTPVRLDILLALTPQVPVEQQNAAASEQSEAPPSATIIQRQPTIVKQMSEPTQDEQQVSAKEAVQQQQRDLIMDHFGSDLMEVDEGRSTSPVASYVVRDLVASEPVSDDKQPIDAELRPEQSARETPLDKCENRKELGHVIEEGIQPEEAKMEGSVDQIEQPAPFETEGPEAELMQQDAPERSLAPQQAPSMVAETEMNDGPSAVAIDDELANQNSVKSKVVVDSEKQLGVKEAIIVEANLDSSTPMDVDATKTPEETRPSSDAGGKDAPLESATDDNNRIMAETSALSKRDSEDATGPNNAPAPTTVAPEKSVTDGAAEGKPKRVKKRIVVVKKKKRVVKKDAGDRDDQADEGQQGEEMKDDPTKPGGSSEKSDGKVATTGSGGPRKVRIPETFQASADNGEQQPPKQTATRRQSALIADVAQKLLQQQQQDGSQAASSAIDMDQHQLASVRVSDTKSEFERRASLAAATLTPPASVSPRGSHKSLTATSTSPTSQLDESHTEAESNEPVEPVELSGHNRLVIAEQEPVATKREIVALISSITTTGEPVIRQEPRSYGQLKVISTAPSEPQTPTNLTEQRPASCDETLARCVDQLSADNLISREGDRSDSVETIKAEWQEAPEVVAPSRDQLKPSVASGQGRNNIRSSLQINLKGASGHNSHDQEQAANRVRPDSALVSAGSVGPAPITRSYKKVTFTKDGTCVTETGRIYSTQADDGTVRRIERKSKVTHYPSDHANSDSTGSIVGGLRATEASTHEEVVYASSSSGAKPDPFWNQSWSQASPVKAPLGGHANQLERLVLPSDNFFDDRDEQLSFEQAESTATSSGGQFYQRERADSASSCSSGSTDVFDDIFDTWTGAISMFNQGRHLADLRNSLMNRHAFDTSSPLQHFGTLKRRNSGKLRNDSMQSQPRPQSGGASFFSGNEDSLQQRCESADMTSRQSAFGFSCPRRRHRHHHRHSSSRAPSSVGGGGRSSADPSGYESDVPFERPASATLGSARGRFGSSNLFPRPEESSLGLGALDDSDGFGRSSDWPDGSLLERMELEHEMIRRRFAQQRKQMWKGSTPTLHELPVETEAQFIGFNRFHPQQQASQVQLHQRSDSGSSSRFHMSPNQSFQQQQQSQPMQTSNVRHTNSGASLKRSIPLDSAPTRRNTANLADHLPPRRQAPAASPVQMRRSTSKTSIITSQLANIRLSQPGHEQDSPLKQQVQQQHKSASFIELKRNSSSSSSSKQQQVAEPQFGPPHFQQLYQQPQQPHNSIASSSSQWADNQLTPTSCSTNATGGGLTTGNSNLTLQTDSSATPSHQQRDAETNSRIQSWLLQSSGNLSVSSGSKSSASDATLPSSSGRSDNTGATSYLASSAGQMIGRHGAEHSSIRTMSSPIGPITAPGQQPGMRQYQQQQQTHVRTIVGGHQLPPAPSRSSCNSTNDPFKQAGRARSPRPAQPISMIVRSTSRQSISELDEPGRLERHKVHEVVETIVSGDDDATSRTVRRSQQTAASSSAQISSRKVFCYPDETIIQQQQQHEQPRGSQIVETRSVTTSSKQMFSQRAMSPMLAEHELWPEQHQGGMFTSGVQQPSSTQLGLARPLDDYNDFDSLIGSGAELDSRSSSSLLDQLRSRGYRSIMNQRMVAPGGMQQQVQPQQPYQGQPQAPTPTGEPDVVTSSSNSMMTMSSSGVGYGPSFSIEDAPPVQAIIRQGQRSPQQQQQQQQQQQRAPLEHQHDRNGAIQHNGLDRALNKPSDEHEPEVPSEKDVSNGAKQAELDNALATNQTGLSHPNELVQTSTALDQPDQKAVQPEEQNGCNGSVPDDDMDEDVREAKANIKGYLDRIRETEKFIKSMHEEEDKLEQQRRESFLFNNLLLSTKLNAIKSNGLEMNSCGYGQHLESCGPCSAPVMMSRASYETHHVDKPAPHLNGVTATSSMMATSINDNSLHNNGTDWPHFESQVSCFSSNLYKPISTTSSSLLNVQLPSPSSTFNYRDPLEPVQPISMHAYAPTTRNWRRSKSQLSDQFRAPSDSSCLLSTAKRPLSANIDCSSSTSNPYFPSRHRRSLSHTRHHQHHSSSLLSPSTTCLDDDPTTMVSEYKSSFGPNLNQDQRRHQRHHSVAPTTSNWTKHSSPRATSPCLLSAPLNAPARLSSDDDDPEMSSYRPGSYKPRLVPETGGLFGKDRGRSSSRLAGLSAITRGRSMSGTTRDSVGVTCDKDDGQATTSIARRRSIQTLDSSSSAFTRAEQVDNDSADDATDWTTRRRSWTTTNEKVQPGVAASGSRLSELEQRLQANKRRREELLQGLSSTTGSEQAPARESNDNKLLLKTGKSRCDDTEEDDDELDQSCGFERPSRRPVGHENVAAQREPSPRASSTYATELHDSKKPAARLRSSRLESMEARIRRKSYCVKVRSPERGATRNKREQQS